MLATMNRSRGNFDLIFTFLKIILQKSIYVNKI